jgi:hypothetical protein
MAPLPDGTGEHVLETTYGGVGQRGLRMDSEPRRPQARPTVDKHLLRPGPNARNAFKQLCRTAFACEADAPHALAACAHRVYATALAEVALRALPRDRTRGRPRQDAQPAQLVYPSAGGLASSLATREARGVQQRGVILATHELEYTQLPHRRTGSTWL